MTLIVRICLAALFLVTTPSAAAPCNPCTGAGEQVVFAVGEVVVVPGSTDAQPHPVPHESDRVQYGRCVAVPVTDNDRLVALHRSIRDGGLGVLRTPTSAFGSAPTAISASNPAVCDAG
jgi:hypothetical protein